MVTTYNLTSPPSAALQHCSTAALQHCSTAALQHCSNAGGVRKHDKYWLMI